MHNLRQSVLVIAILAISLCAQAIPADDSLLNIALTSRHIKSRIDAYVQLSADMLVSNEQKSDEHFAMAMFLCESNKLELKSIQIMNGQIELYAKNDKPLKITEILDKYPIVSRYGQNKQVADLYVRACNVLMKNGIYDKTLTYLHTALSNSTLIDDTSSVIQINNNLGKCYNQISDYSKAIDYFLAAENLSLSSHDYFCLPSIYANIGVTYGNMKETDVALNYSFKSLKYNYHYGDKTFIWQQYNNIAKLYADRGDFAEAITYYKKALTDENGNRTQADSALLAKNIGKVSIELHQYDSAVYWLNNSYLEYQKNNNKQGEAKALYYIGKTYFFTKKYDAAIAAYKKVLAQEGCNFNLRRQVYCDLASVYSIKNNYHKAYEFMSLEARLTDTILATERQQALQKIERHLQIKEESFLYEQKLNKYQQIYQTENVKLQNRNNRLFIILIVGAILFVIIIILLIYVRKANIIQRATNNEINKKNVQLEDIKEKIQNQFKFISHLVNTIPMPMFYTEKDVIIGCNAAFEQACGHNRDELYGLPICELHNKLKFDLNVEILDNQPNIHNLQQIRFGDGKVHDVICYVSLLNSDIGEQGISVMFVDVTDIEQVRRELADSRKQLQDALAVKTKFFSIFAHDLKNPFNGILGMTNLLTEYYDNYTSDEVLKYLNIVNDSATQVYNLLTNLLDWAKTQTGKIDVNPVHFQIIDLINEVVSLNNHLVSTKNIRVVKQIDGDGFVFADKNMILTVLRNLFGNALKYTPINGMITIKTEPCENGQLKVTISDTGIGISHENQQKLFNVDYPISTPGLANEKGSGLGLIICSEFVKQNGGTIWVESTQGVGTTFAFTLNIQ